jgi:hypothetical protein
MKISLDTDNIFKYLATINYCQITDQATSELTFISAKNFNILITFSDGRNLLIKQELHNDHGQTKGEFWSAWQMQELINRFPDLGRKIGGSLPELIYFDPDNSILIVRYLADCSDLYHYYTNQHKFPVEIAKSIGRSIAGRYPSLFTLVQVYLAGFPAITIARPDYLDRAIQFAGSALNPTS